MPETWRCQRCRLVLPVGSYHYMPPQAHYGGAVLLACRACGTSHAVEHSTHVPNIKNRFWHIGEPYFDDDIPPRHCSEDGKTLTLKWYMGPPQLTEWRPGPELSTWGTIEPACVYCGSKELKDRWDEDQPCPVAAAIWNASASGERNGES